MSWVCLLSLLVLASAALSQSEPAEAPVPEPVLEGKTLIDEAYGFSVESPGEDWKWTEDENPHGRSFTVESPDGAQFLYIAAAAQPLAEVEGSFIEEYVRGHRQNLEQSGSMVEDVRHEPSPIPLEGSYRLVMKIRTSEGVEQTFFDYVAPAGRVYSLHAFSGDGAEPPALKPMAASFKLLAPPAASEPVAAEAEKAVQKSEPNRAVVFYSYLFLLAIVMGIGWIVNKILKRPRVNGARVAFFLIALLAVLRLLLVLGSFEAGGDPGLQGEAVGQWTAETAMALVIAHLLARRFKKKNQEAGLVKASVETFS